MRNNSVRILSEVEKFSTKVFDSVVSEAREWQERLGKISLNLVQENFSGDKKKEKKNQIMDFPNCKLRIDNWITVLSY